MQTFVSRTRLAVQRAEDLTATPFEEDNISVVPSDQGQAPGKHLNLHSTAIAVIGMTTATATLMAAHLLSIG